MGHDYQLFVRGSAAGHTHDQPEELPESGKPRILHAGVAEVFDLESTTPQ